MIWVLVLLAFYLGVGISLTSVMAGLTHGGFTLIEWIKCITLSPLYAMGLLCGR